MKTWLQVEFNQAMILIKHPSYLYMLYLLLIQSNLMLALNFYFSL